MTSREIELALDKVIQNSNEKMNVNLVYTFENLEDRSFVKVGVSLEVMSSKSSPKYESLRYTHYHDWVKSKLFG